MREAELSIGGPRATPKVYKLTPMAAWTDSWQWNCGTELTALSARCRMQRGLRRPRCERELLVPALASALVLTVWLGRWPAELVTPHQPLIPELHRTAPAAGPEQMIHLQTVLGPPAKQQQPQGDPRPAVPLSTSLQQVHREQRPTPEPRPSQPAGPFSQVIRPPAVTALRSPPNGTRTILYWTKFGTRDDFYAGYGQRPFGGCPQYDCVTTSNRSLLAEADAIIFEMRGKVLPLPPRRPHQRFVFFLKEPPTLVPIRDPRYRGVFNLTMTYRRDSDVLAAYMSVSAGADATPLPDIHNRSKAVAWIVSNCESESGRELYVDELRRFIDVDVYGKCGPLRCPTKVAHECQRMIANDYHFYLSFENSQCRDYVTEKLFLPLRYGMIPVVLGDNRTLYEQVAPPDSFIHISDFAGPQQLAEYLHYLMTNRTAYSRYHDWRQRYRIVGGDTWCNLCRYLHEPHPAQYYDNIGSWWTDGGACDPGRSTWRHGNTSAKAAA